MRLLKISDFHLINDILEALFHHYFYTKAFNFGFS